MRGSTSTDTAVWVPNLYIRIFDFGEFLAQTFRSRQTVGRFWLHSIGIGGPLEAENSWNLSENRYLGECYPCGGDTVGLIEFRP